MGRLFEGVEMGVALPQVFSADALDPTAIISAARHAEELGFDGLWTQDQVVGQAPTLEPVTLLSFVAAATATIRLGASVLVLPHRTPVPLAKSLATLDQLSRGRLDVGIGIGNPNAHDATFALAKGERVARFNDSVETMKALWSDGPADRPDGRWPLNATPMEPKPFQRPHPRLWFGGKHINAMRRAAQHADAWMGAGSSSHAEFKENIAKMRSALADAGRSDADFVFGKRLYVAIDDNTSVAQSKVRTWFDAYYGNPDMGLQVTVIGSKQQVMDAIEATVESGAEMLLLAPVFEFERHQDILSEALGLQ